MTRPQSGNNRKIIAQEQIVFAVYGPFQVLRVLILPWYCKRYGIKSLFDSLRVRSLRLVKEGQSVMTPETDPYY
jgi:hypothetical protein